MLNDSYIKQYSIFPFGWNVDSPKRLTGSVRIHILSIFKLILLEIYRSDFFRQSLRRDVFFQQWFFVNVICCMLKQFFCYPLTEILL